MKYMVQIELSESEIKSEEQLKDLKENLLKSKTIISNHISEFGKKFNISLLRYPDFNHERLVYEIVIDFNESLDLSEKEYLKKISINKKGVIDSYMEEFKR